MLVSIGRFMAPWRAETGPRSPRVSALVAIAAAAVPMVAADVDADVVCVAGAAPWVTAAAVASVGMTAAAVAAVSAPAAASVTCAATAAPSASSPAAASASIAAAATPRASAPAAASAAVSATAGPSVSAPAGAGATVTAASTPRVSSSASAAVSASAAAAPRATAPASATAAVSAAAAPRATAPAAAAVSVAATATPLLAVVDATLTTALPAAMTLSRPTGGTYTDAAGSLQAAAADVARFDADPGTLAPLGLLIEPGRTNTIRNPRGEGITPGAPGTPPANWTMTGASNGVSRFVVGSGTEDGIPYVDVRVAGTAGATAFIIISPEAGAPLVAVPGTVATMSLWARLIAGTLVGAQPIVAMQSLNSSGSALGQYYTANVTPTSAALRLQRMQGICQGTSFTAAGTAFLQGYFQINISAGAAVDFTIRVGAPQFEAGAGATSVILPPAGAPAATSRAADVVTVTLPTGTWDVLVQDAAGAEWRDAVPGGAYSLVPRLGQTRVKRVRAFAAGSVSAGQKTSMAVAA